jgi:hypothetical protein
MNIRSIASIERLLRQKALLKRSTSDTFERDVLEVLADAVQAGEAVHPQFQELANAVVADAVAQNKLPGRRRGRPKVGVRRVARKRAAVRDYSIGRQSKQTAEEAAAATGEAFHANDRTIERWVAEARKPSEFSAEDVFAEMGLNPEWLPPRGVPWSFVVEEHKSEPPPDSPVQ